MGKNNNVKIAKKIKFWHQDHNFRLNFRHFGTKIQIFISNNKFAIFVIFLQQKSQKKIAEKHFEFLMNCNFDF